VAALSLRSERVGRGWGLASGNENNRRARRDYRPTVEGLEALRLLSSATQAHPLANMAAERDLLGDPVQHPVPTNDETSARAISTEAWDLALVQTHLAELLRSPVATSSASSATTSALTPTAQTATTDTDPVAMASGLSQLNKYLNKTWYRAGIPAQLHDDSTQAVYTALLQNMGRGRFDGLVSDVGNWGVKDTFTRETSDGLAFFRTVDMVKKRAQRERMHQSLESVDVASDDHSSGTGTSLREALKDAIDQSLNPREAALIQDTLMGKTPAEIANQWGVAAKTVSNEKTRVLQKLRSALANYEMN
jgi:RNA polymerase sigma factor (sigma-70 family)